MGIFAGPDQDVGVLPLVDLWLDLADNLKQEDIPDPLEFLKERDAIVRYVCCNGGDVKRNSHRSMGAASIVQAARERAYAALNAPPPATTPKPETAPAQQREADSEAGDVKPKDSTRSRKSFAVILKLCELSWLNVRTLVLRMPKLLRKWSLGFKALKNRVRRFRVVRTPTIPA